MIEFVFGSGPITSVVMCAPILLWATTPFRTRLRILPYPPEVRIIPRLNARIMDATT